MRPNFLTLAGVRAARVPFWLFARRPAVAPKKALILKPCCISQVLLATPMLAAFSDAYPQSQFDWALSSWARPAIVGNPRISEIIDSGRIGLPDASWSEIREFVDLLRREKYDTCLVPSRSSILAWIAWQARIPQRIGLNHNGRGFSHTLAVTVPPPPAHEAEVYLGLARAMGITEQKLMEFYPPDPDRASITRRLIEEADWLGKEPLAILHPGGGRNPARSDDRKQWPAERFALLGNHLVRRYGARILVVGGAEDVPAARAVEGLMPTPVVNLAGELSLGELGALCEVADLYVGGDSGSTHVAAAVRCPTLALFGPTDPEISRPYARPGRVLILKAEDGVPFSWKDNLLPEEAIAGADRLLAMSKERQLGSKSGILG